MLLERDDAIATMSAALEQARAGCGHLVALCGEAGIGKTTLVQHFARLHGKDARVLWGACDGLSTPRPLGPFLDIVDEMGGELAQSQRAGQAPGELSRLLMAQLREAVQPTVLIIEDAHWIDEASADLVRFLGRRVARAPLLLLVSFRSEEVDHAHPLRGALAELPPDQVTHLQVRGLSCQAVHALARQHGFDGVSDAAELHANAGGNPFLVTELLRGGGPASPSLREAMHARLSRLAPLERALVELVSVIPDHAPRWIVEGAVDAVELLQHCIDRGLLIATSTQVRFRHELARRVVEQMLPEAVRRTLHARVLALLEAHANDLRARPQLVHHAEAAADAQALLRHAPLAAQEAARRGAHREAAAFWRAALRQAQRVPPAEHARMLEALCAELEGRDGNEEALAANQAAFELWKGLGDEHAQGCNLVARFELMWNAEDRTRLLASGIAEAAVRLLEPHGASAMLAQALANLAVLNAFRHRDGEFEQARARAIAMVEAHGSASAQSRVLLRASFYSSNMRGDSNLDDIRRALGLALSEGDERLAALAYVNLAFSCMHQWQFEEALRVTEAGLAFVQQRDMDLPMLSLRAYRARTQLMLGDWTAAQANSDTVLRAAHIPVIAEVVAAGNLALIAARRGEAGAAALVERVGRLRTTRMPALLLHVVVLMLDAHARWHAGGQPPSEALARAAPELLRSPVNPWLRSQAAYWLARLGELPQVPPRLAKPFEQQLRGDWAAAAAAFERHGCPFEQAMALMEGDRAARRKAVAMLEALGAQATLARYRELLGAHGVSLPRGARSATRQNALGLTGREMQVLALIERGLSNADIAQTLRRSEHTVAHHVSAILAKLEAGSRQQAVYIAHQRRSHPPN